MLTHPLQVLAEAPRLLMVGRETLTVPLHLLTLPPKFRPCTYFLRGTCYAGTGCVFSHGTRSTTATEWGYFVPPSKGNFEGYSRDYLNNEFTNLETNAEDLMSNVADIQSHCHSINLGSSNPHINGDELLNQHLNPYIASKSGKLPANQIENPSIRPQNPCFATDNLAKEISSEPGMFKDINSTRIPEDASGLNSLDYMGSKH
ncbi:hypothetical protein BKA65DRAFT_204119 [Rhexocercosporidium sp. MPI-PUGE-AT-0058]|nr:hypothetical protein BKA65DRAFT_204119 [Rhexocercosporidium sp. MPI-PUGE-AT-0058]